MFKKQSVKKNIHFFFQKAHFNSDLGYPIPLKYQFGSKHRNEAEITIQAEKMSSSDYQLGGSATVLSSSDCKLCRISKPPHKTSHFNFDILKK